MLSSKVPTPLFVRPPEGVCFNSCGNRVWLTGSGDINFDQGIILGLLAQGNEPEQLPLPVYSFIAHSRRQPGLRLPLRRSMIAGDITDMRVSFQTDQNKLISGLVNNTYIASCFY